MQVSARGYDFEVHSGGGQDGPPVVLLHGFPQHSGEWSGVAPLLHEAGLRTIAIDQRGYSAGARPADPADYTLQQCAADVPSIMDRLGHHHFHVVGHDWGAAVAWAVAALAPERVLTLTAISVAHPLAMSVAFRDPESDQRTRSGYMAVFADLDNAVPSLLADDAARLRRLFTGSGMTDEQVDVYVKPMLDPAALRPALTWYTAAIRQLSAPIEPVRVPTTYVWSTDDPALGPTAAQACGRFVEADYRFVTLPGISHWIPDQAPQACAEAILHRIKSID